MEHVCNPSIREVEAGNQRLKATLWLQREFKASLWLQRVFKASLWLQRKFKATTSVNQNLSQEHEMITSSADVRQWVLQMYLNNAF